MLVRPLTVLLAALMLGLAAAPAHAAVPPVKHVFVIVLENKDYEKTFAADSKAPYLAKTLRARGQLLSNYYATSHLSLGNYITMVSGQAANPLTQADCPQFNDVLPGTPAAGGQTFGFGCVYPARVKTVADQLEARGLRWGAYQEDMGTPCRHPAIGEVDRTQKARVGDQYATRHNPFVYFHSIIDRPSCAANDVDLNRLPEALRSSAATPNFVFITPNLCNDAHDEPCVDDAPGGLESANSFLKRWVPRILDSPAYRKDGLLMVTFDEAEDDDSACCDEPTGPSTPRPGINGPGGGRIGAVLLSRYVKPGSVNRTPYNHYGFLRSVENLFGLPHLGYAAASGLRPFGSDVYNGQAARPRIRLRSVRRIPRCSSARSGRPLYRVRSRRHGRFTHVSVRTRRPAAVRVTARSGSTRVTRRFRLRACRRYNFAVPLRNGALAVRARSGRTHQFVRLRR